MGAFSALAAAAVLTAAPAPLDTPTFDCAKVPPQAEAVAGAESFVYRHAGRDLRLHVFRPKAPGPNPAIVLWFGGGWRAGMVTVFAERAKAFADAGYVAILPDYRVSCRDHTGPAAALADGRAAYAWILEHAAELGVDPRQVVLGGGSSGGHLAIDAALTAPPGRRAAALVLYNPAVDLSAMPEYVRLPKARALRISPIAWDLRALPPTIVMHGEADRTVALADVRAFCRRASDAGRTCQVVTYAGMDHGFFHGRDRDLRLNASPYEDTQSRSLEFLDRLDLQARAAFGFPRYLLAGQSNMSGRGRLTDLEPADRKPDPSIRLYGNDGGWKIATEPVDSADGQVDAVSSDTPAGVGPGLFFARALGGPVALVPCAKAGSAMAEWKPDVGRDTLYGSCLARAREVGDGIAGVLWYQGEADTRSADAARSWAPAFVAFVERVRADLRSPRLPVVFVQLADQAREGEPSRRVAWRDVQAAQASTHLPCAAMVSATGLATAEDQLHLTTASQRVLGARLAAAMRELHAAGCR